MIILFEDVNENKKVMVEKKKKSTIAATNTQTIQQAPASSTRINSVRLQLSVIFKKLSFVAQDRKTNEPKVVSEVEELGIRDA